MHLVLAVKEDTIVLYLLEYLSPDAMYLCGVVQYRYLHHGVIKLV